MKSAVFIFFTFFAIAGWGQTSRNLRVLMVSPEQNAIFQTGGLAHATTGLAKGLNRSGISTEVLMPYYLEMNTPEGLVEAQSRYRAELDWRQGQPHKVEEFSVVTNRTPELTTHFFRHNAKPGQLNYFDNRVPPKSKKVYGPEPIIGESFVAFTKAAVAMILERGYDLVILNDWTAGLIAAELEELKSRSGRVPKVIFAIHNIAYQGLFPKSLADFAGLTERHFQMGGYEYYGQMSFLKAGIQYADFVYTVSPKYAQELTTSHFGLGFDGLIREKAEKGLIGGILNAIEGAEWDPVKPLQAEVKHAFSENDLSGKARGKAELQLEFQLPVQADIPLIILTSRLAEQKGFEYVPEALAELAQRNQVQFLIVGDGEDIYVDKVKQLAERFPSKIRYTEFSPGHERIVTAYADFFLGGPWFEPSGLNQFFSLKNGTIPIVSAVGGLASSVIPNSNGFVFPIAQGRDGQPYDREATVKEIVNKVEEAIRAYHTEPEHIHQMRINGMRESHGWDDRVTKEFLPLFEKVLGYRVQTTVRPLCRSVFAQ